MTPSPASARSRERIERSCAADTDARALREEVLDALRPAVGFDAHAWLMTDPVTSVGAAPLADVPCLDELPRLIRLKYLTDINRWTGLTPGIAVSLHAATGGDLSRSLMWRDLLHNYDVGDVASIVFADRYGCWAFLDLWRSSATSPFHPVDLTVLTDLLRPVTAALRDRQARAFVAVSDAEAPPAGPVVLMLSPELEVQAQTPQTQAYLRILVPPASDRPPIPASAYNVAAQLLAVESGTDDHRPSARVHLSDGRWLTLRAARMGEATPAAARPIAVTIEECSTTDRVDLYARAFGLSGRERELLGHLTAGADTREVAQHMHLSEHTIQDHLKSIFAKTGTRSRRTLLSRTLGG